MCLSPESEKEDISCMLEVAGKSFLLIVNRKSRLSWPVAGHKVTRKNKE